LGIIARATLEYHRYDVVIRSAEATAARGWDKYIQVEAYYRAQRGKLNANVIVTFMVKAQSYDYEIIQCIPQLAGS
jgi:hypothetical protein